MCPARRISGLVAELHGKLKKVGPCEFPKDAPEKGRETCKRNRAGAEPGDKPEAGNSFYQQNILSGLSKEPSGTLGRREMRPRLRPDYSNHSRKIDES
jgi:hypothetical protein